MNKNGINAKNAFEALSLVFVLTVISLIMIFSNFENGIRDFWDKNKELSVLIEDVVANDYVNLDEIDKKTLLQWEYEETKGGVDVFAELFYEYWSEE